MEGPKESDKPLKVHLMIFTYAFEDFVKLSLDFLTDIVRKGINMIFGG